ncbi:MAG TPA: energy transducer TonB [Gemmatimonadaceae bacterium]|nr:energy transducer TonB [Gemmatimonadaceae bacterium]
MTLASMAMHAGLLLLGVWATAESGISPAASPREVVPDEFHQPAPPPDPAPAPRSANGERTIPRVPAAPSVPLAGLNIPDSLPSVDLSLGDPFVSSATGNPVVNGAGPRGPGLAPDGVFDNRIVEKPAFPLESNVPPKYPDLLRSAGIDGEVDIEFVIDPDGRVRAGSIVALRAEHRLFLEAVREALLGYRYLPAEVGGTPVAVRVRQNFSFTLIR